MADTSFKALAANRLSDGIAVWATPYAGSFRWTEQWSDVAPATQDHADALDAWGREQAASDEVVSERLIDVAQQGGAFVPTRFREKIVAAGPTVRPDLGKQAEQGFVAKAA